MCVLVPGELVYLKVFLSRIIFYFLFRVLKLPSKALDSLARKRINMYIDQFLFNSFSCCLQGHVTWNKESFKRKIT